MPGPAIHHIVAQEYLDKVLKATYTDAQSTALWNRMSSGSMGPQYLLGAQGPDFLFFNMNDWPLGGAVKSLAETYWEVRAFLDDLVEKVKSLVPPEIWQAIDTLEALADDAVERSATLSEISQLAGDVDKNIEAIKTTIELKIEDYVTDSFDLFSVIKHPQQDGQPFSDWWWFDTLHLRRTGRYVGTLLESSAHGTAERAYALGYLTHYAADAAGHPFVNIISGGPYRTHAQRHKVAENHQDVWAFSKYRGDELTTSNLARDYVIAGNADKLPPALNAFILNCMRKVYYDGATPLYGKGIGASDLDVAYRTWLLWFTGAVNDQGLPLPQPYSLTAEVVEAWDKFVENVGDIGAYVGNSLSGGGGLLGFLKALAALIFGPILLAGAIIDFVIGEIATLGAAPLRFFLSLCYEALYDAYLNLRKGLVMNGFAFPRVADLADPFVQHMLSAKSPDPFGRTASSLPNAHAYPATKFSVPWMEGESHLVYPWPPAAVAEPDGCKGAPSPYFSADASWCIDDARNFHAADMYEYFRRFAESGTGGTTAAAVDAKFHELAVRANRGGLGNAVVFGKILYAEFLAGRAADFIDLNLDSDRGYAFKSWRKVPDLTRLNSPSPLNVAIGREVRNAQDDILYPDRSL